MVSYNYMMFDKEKLLFKMHQFESDCYAIVYNGLVHSVPKRKVMQNLKVELFYYAKRLEISEADMRLLWYEQNKLYSDVSKRTFVDIRKLEKARKSVNYQDFINKRSEIAFKEVEKFISTPDRLKKACYDIVNSKEAEAKRTVLTQLLGESKGNSPFFICSYHKNAAKDHAPFQGKLYYDAEWEHGSYTEQEKESIRALIRNKQLKSVQWVTGSPVYLCTRPNCKHYFVPVSVDEALKNSVKSLVKKKGLIIDQDVPKSAAARRFEALNLKLHVLLEMRESASNKVLDDKIAKIKQDMAKIKALDKN